MTKKQIPINHTDRITGLIEHMPLNIKRLERINRSPGWHSRYHTHDFFEICYILKGRGTISVEGVTYKTKAGDIFFHKPGERHKGETFSKNPYQLLVIGLDIVGGELQFMLFEKAGKLFPKLGAKQKKNIWEIFDHLLKEINWKNIGYVVLVKTFLVELFVIIIRALLGQGEEIDSIPRVINTRDRELSQKVMEYLNRDYVKKLTVKKIAESFYLSPYHFSRIFKKETSFTLIKYLTRVRIEKAAKLLETSALNIGEIAYEIGFQDIYYFTKVFKRFKGSPPTQYRHNLRVEKEQS